MEIKIEEGAQEVVHRLATLEAPMTKEELEILDGKPEEVKPEGEKEVVVEKTAEELAAEEAAAAEKVAADALKEAEKGSASSSEIEELRTMLRDLRQENIRLSAVVSKHDRVQTAEVGTETDPTVIENLVEELKAATNRTGELQQLVAMMEINPRYEDINEVCSAKNFEDIFETVGKYNAEANGTSFNEEYLKAKVEVWKMPNPYKYMYETIKEFHPAYMKQEKPAEKAAEKPASAAGKSAAEIVREKKPVEAPGSVAGLGGGATEQGGWTAARIDALPENKLHTVPRDIYNKYLTGELDA